MKNLLIVVLLALTSLFSGCSNNQEPEEITPPASISLSKEQLEFDSNEGYQTVMLTANGKWSVSGDASWCSITPENGDKNQTITITVETNTDSEDREANITFRCGDATAQLVVRQYAAFETNYVEMKLEEQGVTTSFNEQTGQVTIEYKGITPPSVAEGKVIVLPEKYGHDIRVVNKVQASGNSVVLDTEQGTMANLFSNIEFTLTTNPDLVAQTRSVGRVVTPVSIEALDEKGNSALIYSRKNVPSSRLDISVGGKKGIVSFHKNLSGKTLYSGSYGSIEWKGLNINAGLDLVMEFVWGEIEMTSLGELNSFDILLEGNLDISMILAYLLEKEASFGDDDAVVINNIAAFNITFMVGPVPVTVRINVDIKKNFSIQSSGSIDLKTGGDFQATGRIGMKWVKNAGVSPVYTFTPEYHFYKPGFEVNGSLGATASFYPELEFKIYNTIGPWFRLIPYVEAEFEGSYEKELGETPEYGWSFDSSVGLEGQMGLDMSFANANVDIWASVKHTFFEKCLYKAPTKIEVDPAYEDAEMEVGKEMEVKFNVSGKNLIADEDVPCPTALVELETEGELAGNPEKPMVTSDEDGVVKVMWTPQDEKHKLKAKVLNKEKNTITEATFSPNRKNTEREALRLLYESTYGDNWKDTTNWLSPVHISEWYGVTDFSELQESVKEDIKATNVFPSFYTGSEEIVSSIDLDNNNLTGNAKVSGFSFLGWLRLGYNLNSLTINNCVIQNRFDLLGLASSNLEELNISNIQFYEKEGTLTRGWFYIEDYIGINPKPPIRIKKVNISNMKQSKLSIDAINLHSDEINVSDCSSPAAFNLRGGKIKSLNVQRDEGLIVLDSCSVKSFDYSGCGLITLDKSFCDKATIKNAEVLSGNGSFGKLTVDDCRYVSLDLSSCDEAIIKDCEGSSISGESDNVTITNSGSTTIGAEASCNNVTITNGGDVRISGKADNVTITNSGYVGISGYATIGTLTIDPCKGCHISGNVNHLIISNYNGYSPWRNTFIPSVTIVNCTIRDVYIGSMSGSSASIDNYIDEVLEERRKNE